MGATQPIGTFLSPPSCKSTQLGGFDILPASRNSTRLCGLSIFYSFCYSPCNGSAPFPSFFPPHLFDHCLNWWSAGTGCAALHLSTTFLHPAISSSRTHDHFYKSFHLIKFIHLPSIYVRPTTVSTSNSSNSSSGLVLGIPISRVPCTPSL